MHGDVGTGVELLASGIDAHPLAEDRHHVERQIAGKGPNDGAYQRQEPLDEDATYRAYVV